MFREWNLLVIEDEPDSAEVMARILKFNMIKFSLAGTAEEALAKLEVESPTALIVDLALPGMNGWDLLDAVRRRTEWAAIPAIAVTAYYSNTLALEVRQAGFDACFSKPVDAPSFMKELARLLNHN